MIVSEPIQTRLFLAALPDAATATRIYKLAEVLKRAHGLSGRLTAPERLHLSLFFLGDLPDQTLQAVCRAAGRVRVAPFDVSFDRSASFRGRAGSRPLVLVGGAGLGDLKSLRQALCSELVQLGLKRRAKVSFEPHVTLLYGDRGVDECPVGEPIGWTVSEFVLIRSRGGHTQLARWPLQA